MACKQAGHATSSLAANACCSAVQAPEHEHLALALEEGEHLRQGKHPFAAVRPCSGDACQPATAPASRHPAWPALSSSQLFQHAPPRPQRHRGPCQAEEASRGLLQGCYTTPQQAAPPTSRMSSSNPRSTMRSASSRHR